MAKKSGSQPKARKAKAPKASKVFKSAARKTSTKRPRPTYSSN